MTTEKWTHAKHAHQLYKLQLMDIDRLRSPSRAEISRVCVTTTKSTVVLYVRATVASRSSAVLRFRFSHVRHVRLSGVSLVGISL